jgi:hypothetical protein
VRWSLGKSSAAAESVGSRTGADPMGVSMTRQGFRVEGCEARWRGQEGASRHSYEHMLIFALMARAGGSGWTRRPVADR